MLNLNDKNVRSRLLEQYLLAETSPQEERLLAEYYRNSLDVPDEEEDMKRLILAMHVPHDEEPLLLSEEKERQFDAIVARQGTSVWRRRNTVRVLCLGLAATLAGALALVLLPDSTSRKESAERTQRVTEVTEKGVFTEIIGSDSTSDRQERMQNLCDFYETAAMLFPDCSRITLEDKGGVILITTTQNDSLNRYYVISPDNTGGEHYFMTELHIGK